MYVSSHTSYASRFASITLRFWQSAIRDVKESKKITLGSSDSTATQADFTYSMQGKVISITYLGAGSVQKELARILRRIEHWHQGPVTSYRIVYQDADWLGGEVKWDGENAEVVPPEITTCRGRRHS
jgi:hypothetical protein